MPINLADIERGAPFTGDYAAALAALQDRLARVQLAQVVHRRRAIVVLEGPEGAGKKAVLFARFEAMERIVVSKDKKSFVFSISKKPFVVWGFNYDHDEKGRLPVVLFAVLQPGP